MSNINFDNPFLLLIGIPMILLILIPFFIAIKKSSFNVHNVTSLVIHLVMCVLVTLVFAKMTLEIVITETNVYVVADVSYSSHETLDREDEYIQKLPASLPKNTKIGLVCFGKDYELVSDIHEEIKSVHDANVDDSETNIADALEYTATLFKPSVIKRIVLITDGKETKSSSIVSVINSLERQDIYVDAIYMDNNLPAQQKEVQINSIDYNRSAFMNREEKVMVLIQSTVDQTPATLYLKDGDKTTQRDIMLTKGLNTYTMPLDTTVVGIHDYQIRVATTEDTSSYNNAYLFRQEIFEKVKMLFISGRSEDRAVAERLYSNQAEIDYYINQPDVPYSLEDLAVYDEYVLSNIDVRTLHNAASFVSNLDVMVSELGKSLITLGNTYIQNNDEESLNKLSNMLPVHYGTNDKDAKLLTIVLDVSRSMELNSKLIMAKKAAIAMLDLLKDTDWVMVIAFWGENQLVQTPVPATDRDRVKEVIQNLKPAQGTMLTNALASAEVELASQKMFDKKEIFLISDGVPYGGSEQCEIVARRLKSQGVTISTLNTNGTGVALMESLAAIGGGYSYFVEREEDLDKLIYTDIANEVTDTVIEGSRFNVFISKRKNEVVENIDLLPEIRGFYFNKTKSSKVTTVLNTSYDSGTKTYEVPIYAYWNYGAGRVASFASDISTYWLSEWKQDSTGEQFLRNVVEVNTPTQRIDSPFLFQTAIDEASCEISIYVPNVNTRAEVSLQITMPDGQTLNHPLIFDKTNFVTQFDLSQVGIYEMQFTYSIGNLTYQNQDSFSYSYKPEYNAFESYDESNLYYMISSTGKVLNTSATDELAKIENSNSLVDTYTYDFTVLWMSICVGLFVIDIIVRKVRWQDIKSLFQKNEKRGKMK